MDWEWLDMLMESLHVGIQIVSVEDLETIPGRHGFHFEPDFCGQMNVVLDERSPDRVAFSCDTCLAIGNVYTLSNGDDRPIRVKIIRSNGNRYAATVIDASNLPG